MFKVFPVLIILFIVSAIGLSSCEKVPAGHVGVKVYLLGSDKGVDNEVLGVGRYWVGWNQELYLFPTFTQNYVWDAATGAGEVDESISFQDAEGITISGDFGIQYTLDPNKISEIFQKYRLGIDEITNTFVRNEVRNALVSEASKLQAEHIYGDGKEAFMAAVNARVRDRLAPDGIMVQTIYAIGTFKLPDNLKAAIDAKITATQQAQQRRNEIETAKAEAEKKVAEAMGQAESIRAVAEAQADANRILAESITPELIEYMKVDKWDGVMPRVTGDSNPLVQVPLD